MQTTFRILVIAATLCGFGVLPAAAADDLLNELEREAVQEEVDAVGIAGSRAASPGRSERYEQFMAQRRVIPAGLTQQEFKLFLFKEFYETYSSYFDLDKPKQRQVYEYYRQLPEVGIASIDSRIRQLLSR